MSNIAACKNCGAQILWARQAGRSNWYPLDPEIMGQPRPSDFPLNSVERKGSIVTCTLVTHFDSENWLPDTAELHRRHQCSV